MSASEDHARMIGQVATMTDRMSELCELMSLRDFAARFEEAFQFFPNGNLRCDSNGCASVQELVNDPQVRFLIELVTGVSVEPFHFQEPIQASDRVKVVNYYALFYTFYRRFCQVVHRQLDPLRPPGNVAKNDECKP